MKRFIGVDLHKRSFTVCRMDEDEKYTVARYMLTSEGMESFKKHLTKSDEVAVEATGNAAHFARSIQEGVGVVRVINPVQFKVISSSVKKTDAHDAVTIARFLRKGLIPEVRLRSKEESQMGSLIGTRDKLVKLRTILKNKVHAICNGNGVVTRREMFSSEQSLRKILEAPISEGYKVELKVIIEQIRCLDKSIQELSEELTSRAKKLKGHKNVTSITGIGDVTAAIVLNAIGDIRDFSSPGKLAAYLGMVPRVRRSDETLHYGRITKMGNKAARTALVQSAFTAIRYNDYLRAFYLRLKAKKGTGKAIVATARKLLSIVHKTLTNDWVFEDFNRFVLVSSN